MTLDEWHEKEITARAERRMSGGDTISAAERAVIEASIPWRQGRDRSQGVLNAAIDALIRLRASAPPRRRARWGGMMK